MQLRVLRTGKAVLAGASLVVAMMFGYSRGIGAQQEQQPAPSPDPLRALKDLLRQRQGTVLTGEDIGFRLNPDNEQRSGAVVGQLVVRVNGQWVEAQFGARFQRAN